MQSLKILRLKGKVSELLEVILEEIDSSSRDIAQIVMKDFSIHNAQTSMHQLWEMIGTLERTYIGKDVSQAVEQHLEGLYQGLYHAYHTIRRLQDYDLCK